MSVKRWLHPDGDAGGDGAERHFNAGRAAFAAASATTKFAFAKPVWLQADLQLMLNTLEKAIRRAGYCRGDCEGAPLTLRQGCLLARWDENGNGRWEGPNQEESEWYGYRLRDRRLEMQRGAESCEGGGWESLPIRQA